MNELGTNIVTNIRIVSNTVTNTVTNMVTNIVMNIVMNTVMNTVGNIVTNSVTSIVMRFYRHERKKEFQTENKEKVGSKKIFILFDLMPVCVRLQSGRLCICASVCQYSSIVASCSELL